MSRKRRRCDCSVCAVWSTKWMKKQNLKGKKKRRRGVMLCVCVCVCVEEQNNLDFTEKKDRDTSYEHHQTLFIHIYYNRCLCLCLCQVNKLKSPFPKRRALSSLFLSFFFSFLYSRFSIANGPVNERMKSFLKL